MLPCPGVLPLITCEGGEARRLTAYSSDAIPTTFTPDGKFVVFSGHRMVSAKSLPSEVVDGIAAGRIEAVLHYSRRSAQAFVEAARTGGVEISALALPQCCLSAQVAEIVREAGATQVTVAARPDENALFEALKRALPARRA